MTKLKLKYKYYKISFYFNNKISITFLLFKIIQILQIIIIILFYV